MKCARARALAWGLSAEQPVVNFGEDASDNSTNTPAADVGGAGLLGIGLGVCVGMIIVGGVAVTSAQLARIDVLDAADHASAAAADRLSLPALYEHGVDSPQLDAGLAAAEARRVLADTKCPPRVTSWQVTSTSVENNEVVVTVSATIKPAVVGSAMASLGSPVHVTLTSRAEAHPHE